MYLATPHADRRCHVWKSRIQTVIQTDAVNIVSPVISCVTSALQSCTTKFSEWIVSLRLLHIIQNK